jgi:hypothetical protein
MHRRTLQDQTLKPTAGCFHAHLRSPPRTDRRGVDLISDMLPLGRLWYDTPDNAIGYAMHSSRSHDVVIRVYDDAGNVNRNARAQGRFQRAMNEALAEICGATLPLVLKSLVCFSVWLPNKYRLLPRSTAPHR